MNFVLKLKYRQASAASRIATFMKELHLPRSTNISPYNIYMLNKQKLCSLCWRKPKLCLPVHMSQIKHYLV
jgi:hypothetical protein